MAVFSKKKAGKIALPTTRPKENHPFDLLLNYAPSGEGEYKLYYALREAVPLIDAAVFKIIRLVGGYTVKCSSSKAQQVIDSLLLSVPVGGNQQGLYAFTESYLEQLITCGTAVGEIITDTMGCPVALYNSPLDNLLFKRAEDGFNIDIYLNQSPEPVKIQRPEMCLVSVLNPDPGKLTGNSMLRGLPFVSGILLKIYESIGQNWERAGNLRYAVTYKPSNDTMDKAFAKDRAEQIAAEWQNAMRKGGQVRDFVAVGDVDIKVIGADAGVLDSEIPVRQMLEQIVAKTGLPPFMLGLSWSSTERMSAQQADALTSELEAYRRILTPVIIKICTEFLKGRGLDENISVEWDDITLQDQVEQSRAMLYKAQANKIEKEIK